MTREREKKKKKFDRHHGVRLQHAATLALPSRTQSLSRMNQVPLSAIGCRHTSPTLKNSCCQQAMHSAYQIASRDGECPNVVASWQSFSKALACEILLGRITWRRHHHPWDHTSESRKIHICCSLNLRPELELRASLVGSATLVGISDSRGRPAKL